MTFPFIIGHRGAKALAPENTLRSFKQAAICGVSCIEFDAKLSKDNIPFILHDDTVDRTTNGTGLAKDMTWQELQQLDAGSWMGAKFTGEKLPSLEQTLNLCLSLGLRVNIELKPCPGREEETAEIILSETKKLWPKEAPAPLISSFERPSLEVAAQIVPDWDLGYLMDTDIPDDWAEFADKIKASTLNINQEGQTAASLKQFKNYGKPVLAYTCNDYQHGIFLKEQGVTAIFTDNPLLFAGQL